MAAQPKKIKIMGVVFEKIKITAILVSFIVFAVASIAGNYVRTNLNIEKTGENLCNPEHAV